VYQFLITYKAQPTLNGTDIIGWLNKRITRHYGSSFVPDLLISASVGIRKIATLCT